VQHCAVLVQHCAVLVQHCAVLVQHCAVLVQHTVNVCRELFTRQKYVQGDKRANCWREKVENCR